jgi:hypothetical protein
MNGLGKFRSSPLRANRFQYHWFARETVRAGIVKFPQGEVKDRSDAVRSEKPLLTSHVAPPLTPARINDFSSEWYEQGSDEIEAEGPSRTSFSADAEEPVARLILHHRQPLTDLLAHMGWTARIFQPQAIHRLHEPAIEPGLSRHAPGFVGEA